MECAEYDDMMRRMLALVVQMGGTMEELRGVSTRLEGAIDELRAFNRQQVAINERLEITQARIETLLRRVLRNDEAGNGREA